MPVFTYILYFFTGFLAFFLLFPFLKVFFSLFTKEEITDKGSAAKEFDFACIITAYKNAGITKPGVIALLKQNYKNFEIYVVADDCEKSEYGIKDGKLSVFWPDPPLKLKAKSIIYAIENFKRKHEYIVVFDADNLAHPDFLSIINKYINNGYRTVQGQRTAKNLDTVYACADATGEFYKNYVERLVPYLIGSSAVISGSGMAVESDLYQAYLASPEIEQGKHKWKKMLQEDKILQNFLLRKNEKIAFAWDAIIYDEKVTTASQVETQRSRWLYSYFQNLPNSTGLLWRGIKNLSWNQFLFAVVTVAPPLFILVFLTLVMIVINWFFLTPMSYLLTLSLFIFATNVLFTLYLSKVPSEIWKALWSLPLFVWNQMTALFKMRDPNKNFKHTEHDRSFSIDEVIKESKKK